MFQCTQIQSIIVFDLRINKSLRSYWMLTENVIVTVTFKPLSVINDELITINICIVWVLIIGNGS